MSLSLRSVLPLSSPLAALTALPVCASPFCPRPPSLWQRWWARHDGIWLQERWYCSLECFQAGVFRRLEGARCPPASAILNPTACRWVWSCCRRATLPTLNCARLWCASAPPSQASWVSCWSGWEPFRAPDYGSSGGAAGMPGLSGQAYHPCRHRCTGRCPWFMATGRFPCITTAIQQVFT